MMSVHAAQAMSTISSGSAVAGAPRIPPCPGERSRGEAQRCWQAAGPGARSGSAVCRCQGAGEQRVPAVPEGLSAEHRWCFRDCSGSAIPVALRASPVTALGSNSITLEPLLNTSISACLHLPLPHAGHDRCRARSRARSSAQPGTSPAARSGAAPALRPRASGGARSRYSGCAGG